MKKNGSDKTSLSELARLAGVSKMTASRALRNKPGVGEATRQRILTLARKLNYSPDARLSSWMTRIHDARAKDFLPIAWLATDVLRDYWHKMAYASPYFEGAMARCKELGYHLEEFSIREEGMTMRRLSHILYQRGIQGIIIPPPSNLGVRHLSLSWKHFAPVSFEKSLMAPRLHRVSADHYSNMMVVLRKLRQMGYRRIGLYLVKHADRQSHHGFLAAWYYFQSLSPRAEEMVPVVYTGHETDLRKSFSQWMTRCRPEVVVGQDFRLVEYVEDAGCKVPHEVGVVHLALEGDCVDWAGIYSCKREIGAATVDTVVSLVQHHQLGLPKTARDILIAGTWQQGKTLLRRRDMKKR